MVLLCKLVVRRFDVFWIGVCGHIEHFVVAHCGLARGQHHALKNKKAIVLKLR
jgi:hypothetical protein